MKRIKLIFINLLTLITIITIFSLNNIYGISSSISGGSVSQGGQITVKISFSADVCAANYVLSYDTSKLSLVSGEVNYAWAEGEALPTYTFKAKDTSSGSAGIYLTGKASDTNFNKHDLSGSSSINITSSTSNNTSSSKVADTTTSSKASTTNTSSAKNSTNTSSTKSNNSYLKTLQVNQEGLSPNFNKSKTNYSITIGQNISSLNVTALPEDSTAKVSVTGNTGLKNGDNKIYVTVTAQDGTKKVYTITVTKTADVVKSNSYLQSLIVENATLSPEFSKENLEYDCGKVGASVESLRILAFGENEKAKVEITGNDSLVEGENKITVKVTSEDGTTTKEYIIKVVKDSSIVEEQNFEEVNPLQDTNKENKIVSLLKDILNRIKANWLIVLMYAVILIEFVQILYLYKRTNKSDSKIKNKQKVRNLDLNMKQADDKYISNRKNISLDKEFKLNKKNKKRKESSDISELDENISNKKRIGAKKFNSDDKS